MDSGPGMRLKLSYLVLKMFNLFTLCVARASNQFGPGINRGHEAKKRKKNSDENAVLFKCTGCQKKELKSTEIGNSHQPKVNGVIVYCGKWKRVNFFYYYLLLSITLASNSDSRHQLHPINSLASHSDSRHQLHPNTSKNPLLLYFFKC